MILCIVYRDMFVLNVDARTSEFSIEPFIMAGKDDKMIYGIFLQCF